MLEKILVPLDGSELGELALPYAEELAGTFDSEVELVSVCEPDAVKYRHTLQLYLERIAELARAEIKAYHAGEIGPAALVKTLVLDGEPAAQIIDYTDKSDINLVIMVSHGRSGIKQWSMGSTVVKVMPRTSKPVLLIRANAPIAKRGEMFSRVLLPLDGSEIGETALPYIRELTTRLKSEVILLRVVATGQHLHTLGGLDYVLWPEQQVAKMKSEAEQYLEEVSNKLRETKALVRCEVRTGDAAEEIMKLAREADVCLITLSTHGHSAIERWTLGSVTHKVLHNGEKTVWLVRASHLKA